MALDELATDGTLSIAIGIRENDAVVEHCAVLRGIDIFGARAKICAGIHHVAIEPEREELIRDIIMMADRGGVLAPAVPAGALRRELRIW